MEIQSMPWNLMASIVGVTLLVGGGLYLIYLHRRLQQTKKQYMLAQQLLQETAEKQQQATAELTQLKANFEQHILHDPVTGLPSRQMYEDRLQQALYQSHRHHLLFAVILLSIDDLKIVNNVLGYDIGNVLLKEVGVRLQGCIRKVDTVCRFSGEEFAILLPQMTKPETVAYVAKRLLEVVTDPFQIFQQKLFLTASVGISIYPADGDEAKTLLKNADIALRQAQYIGGNSYQFYHQELYDLNRRELILNSSLHSESIYQQLVIYYQPQVNLEKKQIGCMEALLRWQHPELGLVPPRDFLRLAEHNGRMIEIGEWVLRQACEQFQKWRSMGFYLQNIAVNVSMWQLENSHFSYNVSQILQEYKIDPPCLMLELAESALLPKLELVEKSLRMLKHLGVKIAIDDFGTGYISLQHLKRFSVDYLKIDNTLTQNITTDKESESIVKMIIALAGNLQMTVVAEGVETVEQKQLLQELGCFIMQGHLFSEPLLPEEFNKKVVENISEYV